MKQLALLFTILVGVMFFVYWSAKPGNLDKLVFRTRQGVGAQEKTVKVGNTDFKVEIAKTEEERRIGLSKHDNLSENSGMLFILEQNSRPSFWMKGMKFAIDIIWIDERKVVDITANVPILTNQNLPDNQTPRYSPKQPVDYVLEVTAGTVDSKKIKIGDKFEF